MRALLATLDHEERRQRARSRFQLLRRLPSNQSAFPFTTSSSFFTTGRASDFLVHSNRPTCDGHHINSSNNLVLMKWIRPKYWGHENIQPDFLQEGTMAEPTGQEILMWALTNQARLDPTGVASYYTIDLNE